MKSTSKPSEAGGQDAVAGRHAAEQAERCRRLAKATFDRNTSELLDRMAEDFERAARAARQ